MAHSSGKTGSSRPGRPPNIRRLAGPAGLCAAVVVAGCGAASAPGSAAKPLSARQAISLAAHTSQRISSATTTIRIKIGGSASATTTGRIQLQLKPSLLANAQMTVAAAGKSIQVREILTGKAIYLRVPGLPTPGGKPWLKISFGQLSGKAGAALSQLLQGLQSGNPLDQTKILSASKDVHAAGTQVIDGVTTTRYTGTFTPSAALSALTPNERKLLGPQLKTLHGTVKFTIWIDGQHQTRQVAENENVAGQTILTTLNVTAINQPVTVTVPPANQVASLPSLTGNGVL
jgi:hypothetical protein